MSKHYFGETLSDFRSNPDENDIVFETIMIVKLTDTEITAVHHKKFYSDKRWFELHDVLGTVKVKHYEKGTFFTSNYAKDAEKYALKYLVETDQAVEYDGNYTLVKMV